MVDIDGENFSLEDFIDFLYNELPTDFGMIDLLPQMPDINLDPDHSSYIFEILITIAMEGLTDAERLHKMLSSKTVICSDDFEKHKINVYKINSNQLKIVDPWIKSLGYLMHVSEYDSIKYKPARNDYCKIILKDNPSDHNIFIKNNIDKSYHFVKNRNYQITPKLENIKATFLKPKDKNDSNDTEKIITIKFEKYVFNKN